LVPINEQESSNYSLGAFQLFMKYSILRPIATTQVIFTLSHQDGTIEFTLTPDETARRFYIDARDQLTKAKYDGISMYQNGVIVKNPYISENEWNVFAVSFDVPLDFSNYSGSINLLYGCNFDKVSFFRSSGLNEFSVVIPRNWSDVLYNDEEQDPLNIVDWQYWYDENGVLVIPDQWKDVYVLEETSQFSITPSQIYSAYLGTNIITMDDNTGVSIEEDDFSVFVDQTWLKFVQKPV
jgi:hypothetical protein